jgi:glycosyltransferase involved in cell wall biosynthesis
MRGQFYISAMNIHTGGGYRLLLSILEIIPQTIPTVVLIDNRFKISSSVKKHIVFHRINTNIFSRIKAEYWLFCNVMDCDSVLCFGNLPPLFRLSGYVTVYIQNRFLIQKNISLIGLPVKTKIRILVERLWFFYRLKNVDLFYVQTPTMKMLLEVLIKGLVPIRKLAFVENIMSNQRGFIPKVGGQRVIYDFIYVASGEPHKNHENLLEAWDLLAKEGIFPSLCLTVDENHFGSVCKQIKMWSERSNLKIENLGVLNYVDILNLYKKSQAVIYPSKFESLGLPLLEARQVGLPVLASELDFVRDVLDPEQVFDPESPLSIARAVKRFIGISDPPLLVVDPSKFLESVFQKESQ